MTKGIKYDFYRLFNSVIESPTKVLIDILGGISLKTDLLKIYITFMTKNCPIHDHYSLFCLIRCLWGTLSLLHCLVQILPFDCKLNILNFFGYMIILLLRESDLCAKLNTIVTD